MKKIKSSMLNGRQGFTLIELVIVIALLGMLSTAGVSSYVNSMKVSRDAKRKTDIETLRQALEMNKSDTSTTDYPGTLNNTYSLNNTSNTTFKDAVSNYIKDIPKDPSNTQSAAQGFDYLYFKNAAGTYTICSHMENSTNSVDCEYCAMAPCPCTIAMNIGTTGNVCNYGVTAP